MTPHSDRDPTLKGVGRRLAETEDDVEHLKNTLDRLVVLTQRIQWTFTGLVIYYIMDHGEITKLLIKGVLL